MSVQYVLHNYIWTEKKKIFFLLLRETMIVMVAQEQGQWCITWCANLHFKRCCHVECRRFWTFGNDQNFHSCFPISTSYDKNFRKRYTQAHMKGGLTLLSENFHLSFGNAWKIPLLQCKFVLKNYCKIMHTTVFFVSDLFCCFVFCGLEMKHV